MRKWLAGVLLVCTLGLAACAPYRYKVGDWVTYKLDGRRGFVIDAALDRQDNNQYKVLFDDYESAVWVREEVLEPRPRVELPK